jgi:hypothetical protein
MALEFRAESMLPVSSREKKFTIQIQNKEHLAVRYKTTVSEKEGRCMTSRQTDYWRYPGNNGK